MTKIRVIDFETTGLPEDDVKAICEAGWTDIFDDGSISETRSVLVNPGHPIPPVTQAIHHISDAEVADAITPTQACQQLMSGMEEVICSRLTMLHSRKSSLAALAFHGFAP